MAKPHLFEVTAYETYRVKTTYRVEALDQDRAIELCETGQMTPDDIEVLDFVAWGNAEEVEDLGPVEGD